jgi:two-component system response regulator HydG
MPENTDVKPARVLIVDDEPTLLRALEAFLRKKGYDVVGLDSPIAATQKLAQEDFDVALLDIKMPQLSGLELLNAVKHRRPEVEVIMMTGHATVETALAAVRAGAYDYLTKPFDDIEIVGRSIAKAAERKNLFDRNRQLESQLRERDGAAPEGLVGSSAPMREVVRMIDAVAYSSTTVLVTGESGTGKELFAQAIHKAGPRADKPFVAMNCSAFPEALLESELFGYDDGAFTGARKGGRRGMFEAAHTGTLFLDEIGDMPVSLQTRLLRVLQEREVVRLGGQAPIPIDVRVIAATHQDLTGLIAERRFRADLYYRLNILRLRLPALRERRTDIPALAQQLLARALKRLGSDLGADATLAVLGDRLLAYAWPGNVRELENLCERLAVFAAQYRSLDHLRMEDLAHDCPELFATEPPQRMVPLQGAAPRGEQAFIEQLGAALRATGGNRQAAAAQLGISRATLWRKMKSSGLLAQEPARDLS